MLPMIKSEFRKLGTVRSPWLLLAAGPLIVVAGITGLVKSGANVHDPAVQSKALAHVGLAAVFTLIFGILLAPFGWITPSWPDFLLFTTFGVISMVALACVNYSLKIALASVVAPYQYTFILWAIALGYVVFGDVPDAIMLCGAGIIIAAGLYIFWRESRKLG